MGQVITLKPVLSYTRTESGKLVIWHDKVINNILQRAIATEGVGSNYFSRGIPIHRPSHSTTSGGIE